MMQILQGKSLTPGWTGNFSQDLEPIASASFADPGSYRESSIHFAAQTFRSP